MAAADTIDSWDGPQDLATWPSAEDGFGISVTSMVKFSDGSFFIAEYLDTSETTRRQPRVRRVFSDGSMIVYDVIDELDIFSFIGTYGVQDMILATDGTSVWLALLFGTQIFLEDDPCDDHPDPVERKIPANQLGIALFGSGDVGDAFYAIDIDPAVTHNVAGAGDPPVSTGQTNSPPHTPGEALTNAPLGTWGFSACASSAQPGVLHVTWGEAGYSGQFNPCDDFNDGNGHGQWTARLSYCRCDNTPFISEQVDLLLATEDWGNLALIQGGMPIDGDSLWCNCLLRNDTGSPVAFVTLFDHYDPSGDGFIAFSTDTILESFIRVWDLTAPVINAPVELQNSAALIPSGGSNIMLDDADEDISDGWRLVGFIQSAPVYHDPLLGKDVYLVSVWHQFVTAGFCAVIYRIPTDFSDTFSYLDGQEALGVGAGITSGTRNRDHHSGDFVSEIKNVWWPDVGLSNQMEQLDRVCAKAWIRCSYSPTEIGPPGLQMRGIDLTGNLVTFVSVQNTPDQVLTLTQQLIARNYFPCNTGMHVWEIV